MATPDNKSRVRASKLRAKVQAGKTLTAEENGFLALYERDSTRAKAKKAMSTTPPTVPVAVSGPQLALGGGQLGPVGGHVKVNVTVPVDASDRIDPKANTWIPTMPETPADAEPPIDGAPKPPPAGTPLVDPATPAAGTGDPHAAEQFAGFVMLIASLGLSAGRELAADLELPDQVRTMLGSDEYAQMGIGHIGQAAQRVALKYGFKSIPMADEVVVAAALVGSGALVFQQQKRKKLKKGSTAQPKQPQGEQPKRAEPEQPSGGLNELWRAP